MTAAPYSLILTDGYQSCLGLKETQIAIKRLKDYFEKTLAKELGLIRVSAPLFVRPQSGLNDNLTGTERPVSFDVKGIKGEQCEIVQSLAKWKRIALKNYGFTHGEGLYTDMNAIRRDDDLDNLHSIYVDQWDWEKVLRPKSGLLRPCNRRSDKYTKCCSRQRGIFGVIFRTFRRNYPGDQVYYRARVGGAFSALVAERTGRGDCAGVGRGLYYADWGHYELRDAP